MESHQRLRDELHSHTSLIHSLRCADANSSIQMLGRLRHGDFDGALLGTDLASRSHSPADRVYPWEESIDESQRQRNRDPELLPPMDSFPPARHDDGVGYPPSHPAHVKPEHPYDRAAIPAQTYPPNFAPPPGLPASTAMMHPGGMHGYDQRIAYQRPEMQYQPRSNSSYQQGEGSHQSTIPSNDPNRNYAGPR